MTVRELRASDIPALRSWHRFEYEFPDLLAPEFVCTLVVVDEDDQPIVAFPAKQTIEMYMLGNPTWGTPRARLAALQLGHEATRVRLAALGYVDANCWIPPQIEKAFARRLQHIFGWAKARWNSYSRSTAPGR